MEHICILFMICRPDLQIITARNQFRHGCASRPWRAVAPLRFVLTNGAARPRANWAARHSRVTFSQLLICVTLVQVAGGVVGASKRKKNEAPNQQPRRRRKQSAALPRARAALARRRDIAKANAALAFRPVRMGGCPVRSERNKAQRTPRLAYGRASPIALLISQPQLLNILPNLELHPFRDQIKTKVLLRARACHAL